MLVRLIASMFVLLSLVACSGSPSDRDIKGAIERDQLERKRSLTALLGERGAAMAEQLMGQGALKDVRKIGCKEDGENAWRCDVEIDIASGDATQNRITKLRLVRSSSGWVIAD